ncbi:MAG: enoyl-CoA hydratase/isomerase family protein [Pseudomonadota bacterium]
MSQFGEPDGEFRPHVDMDQDDTVAIATLTNPERRNAITFTMWQELEAFAHEVAETADISVVLFRGHGEVFSAGADVSDFDTDRSSAENTKAYDDQLERACRAIEAIHQPTVARLEGPVVGAAAALAACCDLRVASEDAFLMVPAARLGLGFDPRAVARLARFVGDGTARWMLITAGQLPARRAFASGALHEVVEAGELDEAIERLVERLMENAPLTIAAAKAALRATANANEPALLERAWQLVEEANESHDYAEGRRAFEEKRPPRFLGR